MSELFSDVVGYLESTPQMRAVFSGSARIRRMLDVEAALAKAEARHGVIPQAAVPYIVEACNTADIDFAVLGQQAELAGNLAIPLIRQLTAKVAQADSEAAKYVHWGATSQDIIDTALILQLRDALDLLETDIRQLGAGLALLAKKYRDMPQVGRTWMQHALPITFGLKVAGWLDALQRHGDRLAADRKRMLVVQFGGAAGTLSSLGDQGLLVAEELAVELSLGVPDMPWHAQRDRPAELATALGLLVGSLGKMARDISLMSQTEVGEVAEPSAPGRGGSSSMPHKRNPVACAATLAAAVRVPGLVSTMLVAMVQENERALGGWQAEWECLPQIVQLAACALRHMVQAIGGLQVDEKRMRNNLELTRGQILAEAVTIALGRKLGRMAAHAMVERACRTADAECLHLRVVLEKDPDIQANFDATELDRLFDPANYTGQAGAMVDKVLQSWGAHCARNGQGGA